MLCYVFFFVFLVVFYFLTFMLPGVSPATRFPPAASRFLPAEDIEVDGGVKVHTVEEAAKVRSSPPGGGRPGETGSGDMCGAFLVRPIKRVPIFWVFFWGVGSYIIVFVWVYVTIKRLYSI